MQPRDSIRSSPLYPIDSTSITDFDMSQESTNVPRSTRSGRDASRVGDTHVPIAAMDQETPTSSSNSNDPTTTASPIIDHATFQQQMFAMMSLLTQSIANSRQDARESTSGPHSTSKEPKVKDPETFHGHRNSLNSFLTECELVFELQPSRFQDDRTKISYMVSYLRDAPLLAVRPLLQENPRPEMLEVYTDFIAYLRSNYGDPDEKGTARRKLKSLHQVGSASSYFAEFQQYVAILGWKDQEPIVDKAIEGLRPNLKDEIARQGYEAETLTDLIKFIIPLDNRLYEREQERRREAKDARDNVQRLGQTRGQNITATATTVQTRIPPTGQDQGSRPQATFAQRTQQWDNQRQGQQFGGPLSDAEKQRRRDHNLCL